MKKIVFLSILMVFVSGVMFSEIDDSPYNDRHTSAGAKKSYLFYKQIYENNNSYEASWKFSRAAYHYADIFVSDKDLKKQIFTEGKVAGEKAVQQNPQGVEGHMYLGICLGSWAKANGIFSSLRTIPVIFQEANKAISINQAYAEAGPLLLRGNVYMKAPKSKGGDLDLAEKDFRKAVSIAGSNRKAYAFLAEVLIKQNKNAEALTIINQGLALPYVSAKKSSEDFETAKLKRLKEQIK